MPERGRSVQRRRTSISSSVSTRRSAGSRSTNRTVGARSVSMASSVRRSKRRRVGRQRNSRVRKMVKAVVKKEIQCSENVGIYTKKVHGDIYSATAAEDFNIASAYQWGGGNLGVNTVFSSSFTPHITKRVLDAVSVLYNGKAKGFDIDAAGNFTDPGFKIDVLHASYELEISNYTDMPYYFDIVEITNKFTSNQPFLEVAKELFDAQIWEGGVPDFAQFAAAYYGLDHGCSFGMIKGLPAKYTIKHNRKLVKPGGTHKYYSSMSGCVDMDKKRLTYSAGAAELASYCKGEKQLVFIYYPALHLKWGTFNTGLGDVVAMAPTYNANKSIVAPQKYGILVEVNEVFKFIEPDETEAINSGNKRCHFTRLGGLTSEIDSSGHVFVETGPSYTRKDPALV